MSMQSLSVISAPFERTTRWLTLPAEIVSHLFFAAAEIGQVQIELFGETLGAVLAFPHQSSRTVDVLFPRVVETMVSKGAVQVRYHCEGSSYEFITNVERIISDRRWRLSLPNAVARLAGRGAVRLPVRRDGAFQVVLEREDGARIPHQIHDLSTTGLSFAYRPARLTLEGGDQLLSTLSLPGGHQLPALLEVRHTRSDNSGLPLSLAGCALLGMSPWGRSLLGQALAGLQVH